MVAEFTSTDWRDRKVREWLLLLLRFAVTREPPDQSAALAMAEELDSLGLRWRPAAPRFFLRTSDEICQAIRTTDRQHDAVLTRHIARIEDVRLRRAFRAAVDLPLAHAPATQASKNSAKGNALDRSYLWKGLPSR